MSATIIPATISPSLCYVEKGQPPTEFEIVAYAVDGEIAKPICYPVPPAKAKIFLHQGNLYRDFDLASGRASGPARSGAEG